MVNKGSSFADCVRFDPHTYARTQQSAALMVGNKNEKYENLERKIDGLKQMLFSSDCS